MPGAKPRIKAINNKGEKCDICGATTNIEVHHIDGNTQNNRLSNLVPLCKECHNEIHAGSRSRKEYVAYSNKLPESARNDMTDENMQPITLRISSDLKRELESEAEKYGYGSRSEYVRHILRARSKTNPRTVPQKQNNGDQDLRDRLDALEDAVFNNNDTQARDSPANARDTPTPRGPETGVSDADTWDMDDLRANLGEWLTANGPQTEHGRRGVLRCVDELEARGPLTSEELTDMLVEEIGDHYSRRKSLWESLKRHLQACPAVRETENYQEWTFVGVEETRDRL